MADSLVIAVRGIEWFDVGKKANVVPNGRSITGRIDALRAKDWEIMVHAIVSSNAKGRRGTSLLAQRSPWLLLNHTSISLP
jgi:hypothetical protein